ncbi:minor tail protein [Arthrobacter phage Inked]|nr:minor tail protein [Arthrobacter phage Inked]
MARTPTDPTKAQVWVTKGIDDLDFEFYFPQGPKGDAGGFTLGTALDNVTDSGTGKYNLNDVVTSGIYRMTATNDNLLIRNFPRNYDTGILEVFERVPGQTVVQLWHTINQTGRILYERTFVTGTWTPWRAFTSTRVDQTAGRAFYQFDDVNGREQLVYGDTGVRQIKNDIIVANGWDAASSNVYLRRVGNVVELRFDVYTSPAGTIPTVPEFLNMAVGFRYPNNGSHADFMCYSEPVGNTTIGTVIGRHNGSTMQFLVAGRMPSNVRFVRGGSTWITSDPWPTTLPGTAVGTIPNI